MRILLTVMSLTRSPFILFSKSFVSVAEDFPQREHDRVVPVGAMYVDKYPVTNAKYAAFLRATDYAPADRANWLRQSFNFDGPTPRGVKAGWDQKPVTYVSLLDARAYCAHEEKRLPSAIEWQFIAQSGDPSMLYPWGAVDNASLTPAVSNDWVNPGPEPVGAHPDGASKSGVEDLVRSVWQMTSVFEDDHTRAIILRGGSNYGPWRGGECRWIENDDGTPRTVAPGCYAGTAATPVPGSTSHVMGGSKWYFPPAFALNTYNKYFLMGGSYERAGTVGFRCVADAVDDCGTDKKLCVNVAPIAEHASIDLDAAAGSSGDWVHFTAAGGKIPLRKQYSGGAAHGDIAVGFGYASVVKGVAAPNGTHFTWRGGDDRGGVLISPPLASGGGAGVSIRGASAPSSAQLTTTLKAFLAPARGGVSTILTANSSGFTKSVSVPTAGGVVTIAYDSDRGVAMSIEASGVDAPCTVAQLAAGGACVGAPRAAPDVIQLDAPGVHLADVLDWTHWGGIGKMTPGPTADWDADAMATPIYAALQPATCSAGSAAAPSMASTACAVREYSEAAATFRWTNGAPMRHANGSGGVFASDGTFVLQALGARTKGAVQRLKMYAARRLPACAAHASASSAAATC